MGWGWEEGKATGVSSVHSWVCCSVAKSCLTLCDPLVYSLPGSSVSGIFRARILDWVATPSSRGSSWSRDRSPASWITVGFFTTEPPGSPTAGFNLPLMHSYPPTLSVCTTWPVDTAPFLGSEPQGKKFYNLRWSSQRWLISPHKQDIRRTG